MTTIQHTVTRSQADVISRHFVGNFVEHPDSDLDQTARELSAAIHADVKAHYLDDVIDSWRMLDAVLDGSHPAINRNRAGTLDNTADLIEYCRDMVRFNIRAMLDNAGVRP